MSFAQSSGPKLHAANRLAGNAMRLEDEFSQRASEERSYAKLSKTLAACRRHTELAEIFEARVRFLTAMERESPMHNSMGLDTRSDN